MWLTLFRRDTFTHYDLWKWADIGYTIDNYDDYQEDSYQMRISWAAVCLFFISVAFHFRINIHSILRIGSLRQETIERSQKIKECSKECSNCSYQTESLTFFAVGRPLKVLRLSRTFSHGFLRWGFARHIFDIPAPDTAQANKDNT